MAKIATAERVSLEPSDNFVLQRSRLAYHYAAKCIAEGVKKVISEEELEEQKQKQKEEHKEKAEDRVEEQKGQREVTVKGNVLEIGTGAGYGIKIIAPYAKQYITIDKFLPSLSDDHLSDNVEMVEATVPPLPFADASFDYVVSFQVIEHIKADTKFVEEVYRVLKPNGKFIVSTPNIKMSLTRNPWHVREYTSVEFRALLNTQFNKVECMGVSGNDTVMAYYEKNRQSVAKITRFDILDLQHRLPAWMLQIPYDILNRLNRRKLLEQNSELTQSIVMDDYFVTEVDDSAFDLIYIGVK